jgi:hypothetical protein
MDDLTKTQRSFARKALHQPKHRFTDLYHLICLEEWIATALHAVLANTGSDHVSHTIVLNLIERRVADRRILTLIRRFLKAGVMDGGLVHETDEGTSQGNIVSPLLANLYLTELDRYWWDHHGGLSRGQKSRRRRAGRGNPVLLQYADDLILVTNGPKAEAFQLRDELQQFLAAEL